MESHAADHYDDAALGVCAMETSDEENGGNIIYSHVSVLG